MKSDNTDFSQSDKVSNKIVSDIVDDYQCFLEQLKSTFNIKNIEKQKVYKLLSKLKSSPNQNDICLALANISRFTRILPLLEKYKDDIKQDTIKRMIAGNEKADFYSEPSDNFFFEFDIATRLKNRNKDTVIDLKTKHDVIVDNNIIIECKKIHSRSQSSFRENVLKAVEQIDDGVDKSVGKVGFIAIDLTNIIDHEIIKSFFLSMFNEFYSQHKEILSNDDDILRETIHNKNFRNITQSYSTNHLEYTFHRLFNKKNNSIILSENVLGIFFQAESYVIFENDEEAFPVAFRMATYYINEKYKENDDIIRQLFKSLQTGI